MLDFLIAFFTDYGYFAVFGILILCGFGLPIPEDITLVSGGVISGLDLANPHTMCFVGLAGVLIGDSTMFLAGRIFGYRIQRIRTFRRILSPRRFSQIQRKFKQYGLSLLFVARFLPGLRSPIYLVAGMSRRIPYHTFILMDGFAALISVPVWIYMGYFFADNLDLLMEYVKDVQKLIYLCLGLVLLVVLIIYLKKRFHHKLKKFTADDEHHDVTPSAAAGAAAATVSKAKAATAAAAAAAVATASPAATASDSAPVSAVEILPSSEEGKATAFKSAEPVAASTQSAESAKSDASTKSDS